MRCRKCGEVYKTGQTFCLRCGSPIQADEDFGMEEYLANDVEDMINEVSYDDMYTDFEPDLDFTDDNTVDIDKKISRDLNNLKNREQKSYNKSQNDRYNNSFDDLDEYDDDSDYEYDDFEDDDDDIYSVPKRYPKKDNHRNPQGRNTGNGSSGKRSPKGRSDGNKKQSKGKNTKNQSKLKKFFSKRLNRVIITIVGILLLALIVYGVSNAIISSSNNEDYEKYYNKGVAYEQSEEYDAALTQYLKASQYAMGDEKKIDVYESIWRCYQTIGDHEVDEISVLEMLISLDDTNVEYYESLIILYQNTGNSDKIDDLIASISDKSVKSQLEAFDSAKPVPSVEPGTYDKAISIVLSSTNGNTIYYTMDSSNPTTDSQVYSKKIKLKKDGTYVIKAIAVDSAGTVSQTLTAEYVIELGTVEAPNVSPETGTYTTETKIEVDVPDDVSVFYTDDGTTPNKKSTKYTKEFDMPEGNTIYKFIAYNKGGIASEVVTRVYVYSPVYVYSYDDAVNSLSIVLVNKGIIESTDLIDEDGSVMYYSYKGIFEVKDDGSYYLIEGTKEDEDGNTVSTQIYAVGCDTGSAYLATWGTDGYELGGTIE